MTQARFPHHRHRRPQSVQFRLEQLEDRLTPSGVESLDGTGNNLQNPTWGSTGIDLLRLSPADYADGISAPAGADRPSARLISNEIVAHPEGDIKNDRNLSALIYAWGQFIDHDIDLTTTGTEAFPIAVPAGDPYFDPTGTGTQTISLSRSNYDPATGITGPRQQINSITAFIDGSMVYGSDATTAASLRTFVGGQLKTSAGNLLPYDNTGTMFLAGDIRANENIELTSLQTLFVREHNRLATQIAANNPGLTDEQIYQQARRLVIAELQVITYREFLPALLGPNALAPYQGYNPSVNPSIATEFSTAAFRVGHTMLGDDIEFLDNNGNEVREAVALKDAFFNPALLASTGIDSILKYLASDNAEEIDVHIVDSVRNFLFGQPGQGGLDLASLNIQRGRDHGLADYNTVREAYGLPRVQSFTDITSDVELQQNLAEVYGSVDNIDLWVGGLAEDHVAGSSLGPTFQRIIADQFQRLRDGDRFWYQRQFSGQELDRLEHTTLADIIRRNTTTTNLQDNVFVFNPTITGRVFADQNSNGKLDRGEPGLGGRTIDLLDTDGVVVASLQTRPDGSYRFDGLDLGTYRVREVSPQGRTVERTVQVTRGGVVVVDLAEPVPQQSGPRPGPGSGPRPDGGSRTDLIDIVFADPLNSPGRRR